MWLEKLTKKEIIKLSFFILIMIFLVIGVIFAFLEYSLDNSTEVEGTEIVSSLKPSAERNEDEEKAAVQKIISDINTKKEGINVPILENAEQQLENGELSEESYNEYLKQIRSFSRRGEFSEISNLVFIIRNQYNLTSEQKEILYPFLMVDAFNSETFEGVRSNWFELKDIESKFYMFFNFKAERQAGLLKNLDMEILPSIVNGVEILEIVDNNVGWNESLAWKYFSDEEATHIYKIVAKFNQNDNQVYNIYYVENDILGNYITNITTDSKQSVGTSYKDYFELTGIEPEFFSFDGI